MTEFSEGIHDADFAHLQTGKSDVMTAQVCLRAMQGYELERLGRGDEAMEAWSVVTDRLVQGVEEMDHQAMEKVTATVVRWQMSVKDGKGFEHADRHLDGRLRGMARHNIPKKASMAAAMEVVDKSFDGRLNPYRESLQRQKEEEARRHVLKGDRLPQVRMASPSPERSPLLSPPGALPWRPTQRRPQRGMDGERQEQGVGKAAHLVMPAEGFRSTMMIATNGQSAPDLQPCSRHSALLHGAPRQIDVDYQEFPGEHEGAGEQHMPTMQSAVTKAIPTLFSVQEPARLHQTIASMAREALGATSVGLALLQDDKMCSVPVDAPKSGQRGGVPGAEWSTIPLKSPIDTAIKSRRVVSVQTVEDYEQILCKICRVWVPLLVGSPPPPPCDEEEVIDTRIVIAMLELCLPVHTARGRSGLTEEETSCIDSLSTVAAQALSLAKERMQSQRAVQQATCLAEAAVAFWELDQSAMFERVCDSANTYMATQAAAIFITKEGKDRGGDKEKAAVKNTNEKEESGKESGKEKVFDPSKVYPHLYNGLDESIIVPFHQGIVGNVAGSATAINISNAHQDPRYNPRYDRQSTSVFDSNKYDCRCILAVPLLAKGDGPSQQKVIGVLQVTNRVDGMLFDEKEDIRSLQAFADCVARSMHKSAAYQRKLKQVQTVLAKSKALQRRVSVPRSDVVVRAGPSSLRSLDSVDINPTGPRSLASVASLDSVESNMTTATDFARVGGAH